MSFSEKKFRSFAMEKQKKKLFDLLQKIETKWEITAEKNSLIVNYTLLANLTNDKHFAQINFTNKQSFLLSVGRLENLHNKNKRDWQILSKDQITYKNSCKKIPLALILDNLRSAFNVGAILRTAECFNIQEVAFCGITPDLQNEKVKKTSMGCWKYVAYTTHNDTLKAIQHYKNKGYTLLALETTTKSLPLSDIHFDKPTALVLGNEALGIQPECLDKCDEIYQIELNGWKNSLNVGICCGIALHELNRKYENIKK